MKVYELSVLFHPDLEMNLEPAQKKLEKIVSDAGGKIIKTTEDGKKHLAYKIGDLEYAIFNYYDVELPPEAPHKMSDAFNIADEVIRYLLVVKDERKEKLEAKRREAEAKRAANATEKAEEEIEAVEEAVEEVVEAAEAIAEEGATTKESEEK